MIKKLLLTSDFSKRLLTLVTGAGIAQLITFAATPFLTRIFSTSAIGELTLILSTSSIFGVIATGRYEQSIILSKNKEETKSIIKLIFYLVAFFIFIYYILYIFLGNFILNILNINIGKWVLFVPVVLVCRSFYLILDNILIREKQFRRLSLNKLIYSSSSAVSQLTFGFLGFGVFGLVMGNVFGYFYAIVLLLKNKVIKVYFSKSSISIFQSAKKYNNFPKYDVPAMFINLFAHQIPLIVLGSYFNFEVLGLYGLMYRVLMQPINLLSIPALNVFQQRATEDYNSTGNFKDIYMQTFKYLFFLGLLPFIVIITLSPVGFSWVFGNEWKRAGIFAQIMAPMFFLNFISSTLSYSFHIVKEQRMNLIGHIFILFLNTISVVVGVYYKSDMILIVCLSIVNSIIYILYIYVGYVFSKRQKSGC